MALNSQPGYYVKTVTTWNCSVVLYQQQAKPAPFQAQLRQRR
jgi:hypothetical protein